MNTYNITYKRYNERKSLIVFAASIKDAIDDTYRHLKRNYCSNAEVIEAELIDKVDVFYKTKKKK